jgi:hypothetical protein
MLLVSDEREPLSYNARNLLIVFSWAIASDRELSNALPEVFNGIW